jgi:hypothetical protein
MNHLGQAHDISKQVFHFDSRQNIGVLTHLSSYPATAGLSGFVQLTIFNALRF